MALAFKKMYVYISEYGTASYIELLSDPESDLPTLKLKISTCGFFLEEWG